MPNPLYKLIKFIILLSALTLVFTVGDVLAGWNHPVEDYENFIATKRSTAKFAKRSGTVMVRLFYITVK